MAIVSRLKPATMLVERQRRLGGEGLGAEQAPFLRPGGDEPDVAVEPHFRHLLARRRSSPRCRWHCRLAPLQIRSAAPAGRHRPRWSQCPISTTALPSGRRPRTLPTTLWLVNAAEPRRSLRDEILLPDAALARPRLGGRSGGAWRRPGSDRERHRGTAPPARPAHQRQPRGTARRYRRCVLRLARRPRHPPFEVVARQDSAIVARISASLIALRLAVRRDGSRSRRAAAQAQQLLFSSARQQSPRGLDVHRLDHLRLRTARPRRSPPRPAARRAQVRPAVGANAAWHGAIWSGWIRLLPSNPKRAAFARIPRPARRGRRAG